MFVRLGMMSDLERRLSGLPEEELGEQSPPAIATVGSPSADTFSPETSSVETSINLKGSRYAQHTPTFMDIDDGADEPGAPSTLASPKQHDASYFMLHRPQHQQSSISRTRESSANNSSSSLRALDENQVVGDQDPVAQTVGVLANSLPRSTKGSHTSKEHRHSLSHTKSSSESHIAPPAPVSVADYPVYPNQSYQVLQSQVFPSRAPPLLRTRSSHPSQFSLYSDISQPSTRQGRDRTSPTQGSRTAGNTPASSPGLFSPRSSRSTPPASVPADEVAAHSPYLHPTHMQTPKETHTAEVDFDPMTGNKLINNYEVLEELGRGEHGKVKLGRDLKSGQKVAIKIVPRFSNKRRLGKLGSPEDKVKKEVAILKKARHPNVVSLLEVIDDPNRQKVYIVLEYVEKGEIIWRKKGLKEIIAADKRRLQREKSGIPETQETFDVDLHSVQKVQAHRHQRELIEAQQGLRPVPGWSLEHGAESDDDKSADASRSLSRNTDDFEHEAEDAGLREGGEVQGSEKFLQGSMYGAYVPEMSRPRHMSMAMSFMSHQSSEIDWDDEDDELAYVPCLTISEARNAFRDTLLGLEFLHFQGIIHRDIKPANLLITSNNHVKVSDFGVSYLGRPVRDDDDEAVAGEDVTALDDPRELSKTVGTPAFYAPELCYTDPAMFEGGQEGNGPKITGALDLWSLGVTLYGMIFGRLPFLADNEYGMFTNIVEAPVFIPSKRLKAAEDKPISREGSQIRVQQVINSNKRLDEELAYESIDETLKDLLQKLLVKDPAKRMTIKGAKLHPWVTADIADPEEWYKSTAPDMYGAKRIEVSKEEVAGAVSKTSFVERVRSAMGRLGGLVTRQPRKRAPSAAAHSETGQAPPTSSSTSTIGKNNSEKETRRASLRGDETILSALRTSREGGDHPLSQSVTASPDMRETSSYFQTAGPPNVHFQSLSVGGTPILDVERQSRPMAPERAVSELSTAESTRTVRAVAPLTERSITPPPLSQGLPGTPNPLDATTAALGGIFGGAGRRLAKSIRSRERRPTTERSPSAKRLSIDSDAHGEPSLAINTTSVAGEVHTPEVLRSPSPKIERQPRFSPVHAQHQRRQSYHQPQESSTASFERAQEINNRKYASEAAEAAERAASRADSQAANDDCPPSPDDEMFYNKIVEEQSTATQQLPPMMLSNLPSASTIASSSNEDFASGMSQSYSHPSIPSVVSGASSLSGEGYMAAAKEATAIDTNPVAPYLRTGETITAHDKVPPLGQQRMYLDGEDEDDSEDEGLSFGQAKGKPIGKM